jgi:hypothetical protein
MNFSAGYLGKGERGADFKQLSRYFMRRAACFVSRVNIVVA